MGTPKTFCVLPWIHRFTNVGGEIQLCCTSEEHDNAVRDGSGRALVAPADLDDARIMNSPFMREIRRAMLDGRWPEACARCRVTEEAGGVSRREMENLRFSARIPELLSVTDADGGVPLQVSFADFRLGNLCNLACRMCNPRSSSKWQRECREVAHGLRIPAEDWDSFGRYDWFESERFADYFASIAPSLEHLHFAGGEPLISRAMVRMLRHCVETGRAGAIELSYNTNLTRIPEELRELWPRFRGVRLYCSVDGAGALNELIRHPSRWADIDRNLRLIDRDHEALGVKEALVMCTTQAYNVLRLQELYDYLADTGFRFVGQLPCLVDLHYPEHLQSTVLPAELKELAALRMDAIEARSLERIREGVIPSALKGLLDTLRGTRAFMLGADDSFRIPAFLDAARSFDAARGQDLFAVVPELRFLVLR